MKSGSELAGIEYHGIGGSSKDCQDAILRLLQGRERIIHVRILSYSNHHALLLAKEAGDHIAIKSGFSSGYGGTGPTYFSVVLQLLDTHGAEIDECDVEEALLGRLDRSALTIGDENRITNAPPIRPSRWPGYILERHFDAAHDGTLWREFPPVIPFGIIDSRIMDLARSFWDAPDDKLMRAYRRLEDAVRKRTRLAESGSRLFSNAFLGPKARLRWKDLGEGEQTGRANLFMAAYTAHRNPRAHRELKSRLSEQLSEFLLLNHLYHLEKKSRVVRGDQRNLAESAKAT